MSRRSYARSRRVHQRTAGSSTPQPTHAAYAFVGGSFAALFPSSTGNPKTATDAITGKTIRRYQVGSYDSAASPTLDYASKQATTVAVVWRARTFYPAALQPILDSSGNGATNGYQLAAWDIPARVRQVFPRISNGSSWVVDYTGSTTDGYEDAVWNITVCTSSATKLLSNNLKSTYLNNVVSASLPSGAAGAMICGNSEIDVMAIELYQGGLADSLIPALVDKLAALCGNIETVGTIANDGVRYLADPGGCRMPNNTILAVWQDWTTGGSNDGPIKYCTIDDSTHPATIGAPQTLPFSPSPSAGNGWYDPTAAKLANGDVLVVANYVTGTTLTDCELLRSSNNGANWGGQTRITKGYALLEICAAPIVQTSGGRLFAFMYVQGAGRAHWDARAFYSDDNGATWPGDILLADGVVDGKDYAEPGGVYITQASPDGSLSAGTIYVMIRFDAGGGGMRECVISTPDGTPSVSAHVATNIGAFSAARVSQVSDGSIVTELRDVVQQRNTLYVRNGAGSWTAATNPAPSIECTPGTGQYGAICSERTAGLLPIITATRTAFAVCQVNFKNHPLYQLYQFAAPSPRPAYQYVQFGIDASDASAVWPGASGSLMGSVESVRRNFQNGSASDLSSPSGHQPAYGAATVNGLNILDFSNAVTSYAIATLQQPFSDLTFEAIVKVGASVAGDSTIVANVSAADALNFALFISAGNLRIRDFTTSTNVVFSDIPLSINTTYRIVVRRTGNIWDAWRNNTKSTLGASAGAATAVFAKLLLGADSFLSVTEQFAGGYGEAYLWQKAITDAQIASDYTSTLKAKWGLP